MRRHNGLAMCRTPKRRKWEAACPLLPVEKKKKQEAAPRPESKTDSSLHPSVIHSKPKVQMVFFFGGFPIFSFLETVSSPFCQKVSLGWNRMMGDARRATSRRQGQLGRQLCKYPYPQSMSCIFLSSRPLDFLVLSSFAMFTVVFKSNTRAAVPGDAMQELRRLASLCRRNEQFPLFCFSYQARNARLDIFTLPWRRARPATEEAHSVSELPSPHALRGPASGRQRPRGT